MHDEDSYLDDLAAERDAEAAYDQWEFAALVQKADAGVLAAGEELFRRGLRLIENLVSLAPEFREDFIRRHEHESSWLMQVMRRMLEDTNRPIAHVISPPTGGNRPRDTGDLFFLRREARRLVNEHRSAGMGTKEVFDHVAEELTAQGHRNTKGHALKGPTIRAWFYGDDENSDNAVPW